MNDVIPFGSLILRDMVSTEPMRLVWSEENLLQTWMDAEKAATAAQAELGLIPREAADTILKHLNPEALPADRIRAQAERNRHLMVSFLKAFRDVCGPAAEHFHVGATTQDILDTALALQIKEAHRLILRQALDLEDTLCRRAEEHCETVMMGRTHEQPALPLTFGFVLATWATEIRDHIERAKESEKRWMYGSLAGGVGAQNAFVEMGGAELDGIETARRLQRVFCEKLGLRTPVIDIQARLDRFAEIVANLASLCSTLGRIGLNLRSWGRPEVMETETPYGPEEYSSSTMPNKRNPESCERVEGLASLVRSLAHSVQEIPIADHRDSVRVPVLYVAIPMSYMLTSRGLEEIGAAIGGLEVHAEQMLLNLDHPNALGQAAAERLMISLYRKTGKRDWAHTVLQQCCRRSHDERRPLAEVVLAHPELAPHFTGDELENLMDLSTYTGTAASQTRDAVTAIRQARKSDLARYGNGSDST